jgi:hypothetical protein
MKRPQSENKSRVPLMTSYLKSGRVHSGSLLLLNRAVMVAAASLALSACSKTTTFSLLADSQNFQQAAETVNNKIDILWVVDNSGSMDSLQANLNRNFSSFINNFQSKGFDFQLGVTTSDAYLGGTNFYNDLGRSMLRDGATINSVSKHTGFPILTPATPDLLSAFITNATQGSAGSGDERVFSSLVEALNNPRNHSFHRPGAFTAVIILSDEDDFSDAIGTTQANARAEGGGHDQDYSNTNLMKTDELVSYLDAMTASTAKNRMYNVSAITVADQACQTAHAKDSTSAIIGKRYIELATKTNGVIGSVCDASYASSLNFIQQRIVELTTLFKLAKVPNASTLKVLVNGVQVASDATNGWTYNSDANAIAFHGSAVPSASAAINVSFDPTSLQ